NGRTGKTSKIAPSAPGAVNDRACAQCNAGGEPLAQVEGVAPPVYLHPECRRFWLKDHPEADGIPDFLPRKPPPGSQGNSLDDFKYPQTGEDTDNAQPLPRRRARGAWQSRNSAPGDRQRREAPAVAVGHRQRAAPDL